MKLRRRCVPASVNAVVVGRTSRKPHRQSPGELKQIVQLRLVDDDRLIRGDDHISWICRFQRHPAIGQAALSEKTAEPCYIFK